LAREKAFKDLKILENIKKCKDLDSLKRLNNISKLFKEEFLMAL